MPLLQLLSLLLVPLLRLLLSRFAHIALRQPLMLSILTLLELLAFLILLPLEFLLLLLVFLVRSGVARVRRGSAFRWRKILRMVSPRWPSIVISRGSRFPIA